MFWLTIILWITLGLIGAACLEWNDNKRIGLTVGSLTTSAFIGIVAGPLLICLAVFAILSDSGIMDREVFPPRNKRK